MSEQDPLALAADLHLQKAAEASAVEELKKHNYLTMLRNDRDLYRALTVIQNSMMPYEPEKMSFLFKELKDILVSRSEFIKSTVSQERVAKIRTALLCLQELRDSEEVHISVRFFASFVLAEDQESELKAREKQSPVVYAQAMEWAGYFKSLFLFGSKANEDFVPSTPSFTIYDDLMKVERVFEGKRDNISSTPEMENQDTVSQHETTSNDDRQKQSLSEISALLDNVRVTLESLDEGLNSDETIILTSHVNKSDFPLFRLLKHVSNGVSDDNIRKAEELIKSETLTVNELLNKIDVLLPFSPTVTAQGLADLLQVSKTAVLKTDWWQTNRRGVREFAKQRRLSDHEEKNSKRTDRRRIRRTSHDSAFDDEK